MQRIRIMKDDAPDRCPTTAHAPAPRAIEPAPSTRSRSLRVPVIIGATALTGIGLGLIAVITGSFLIGLATEAVLAPTLLAKVAGGIAGGGMGMAKGVNNAQWKSRPGGSAC